MNTTNGHSMFTHVMMNPMVRKLDKVKDRDESNSATYSGIVAKTLFFLILTGAGVALYFFVHQYFISDAVIEVYESKISLQEFGITAAALFFTVFSPILIWLIKPLIPFFGSLYCLSQGFLVAWLCTTFGGEYTQLAWIAFGLTMLIVFVMLVLYVTGIVKVTAKFRSVVSTLFICCVLLGIAGFVCSMIPALSGIYQLVMDNMVVSIVTSVLFIIVASLFLLVDFDCIKHTVEDKLPKRYEWMASMALVFTVIWLYFKILNLLLKLTSKNNSH